MCVPRIQKKCVLEEYKKRMCVRRIQNKECVLEEYKTRDVCSKNTKQKWVFQEFKNFFLRLMLIRLGVE